jgi:uncharacterized protein (DUF1697 family)
MNTFVGLLRAVNVGGTGKLPMRDLKNMCLAAGFHEPRTYIASGNVVFRTELTAEAAKAELERRLEVYAKKKVGVMIRTGAEMKAVWEANPFPHGAGNRVVAIFLDHAPPADALEHVTRQTDEKVALGTKEIYVHYGAKMAGSRLNIPAGKHGTARNMNTIAKLMEMTAAQPNQRAEPEPEPEPESEAGAKEEEVEVEAEKKKTTTPTRRRRQELEDSTSTSASASSSSLSRSVARKKRKS